MPFEFHKTDIPEVLYIETRVFDDERGSFAELFKKSDFLEMGISLDLVQVNHSRSKKNVVRALHYQKEPKAQGKLAVCAAGEVFDVAVDIRKGSPTYGKWAGKNLSAEKRNALYIPSGFAHGFSVLSDEADLVYFVFGSEYAPESEAGVRWDDAELGIDWLVDEAVLLEKDKQLPSLAEADNNFEYHG